MEIFPKNFKLLEFFSQKISSWLTVNYIWMYFNHPVIFSVNFRPIIFVYLSLYSLFYRFFGQIYRNSDFSLPLWSLRVCLSLFLSSCLTKKKILDSTLWAAPSKSSEREKEEKNPQGKSGQKLSSLPQVHCLFYAFILSGMFSPFGIMMVKW